MESMTDEQKKRFYESAKAEAKDKWEKDPQDSAALTRWGGALLELANFSPGEDAAVMVEEAVDKFKMALKIDPRKHEASWCLGNAYTSQAFLSEEKSVAAGLFSKAKDCFASAVKEQPENAIYKKGLDMTRRAPELYDEIQKQMYPSKFRPQNKGWLWFDVLGYVTVLGTIMTVAIVVGRLSASAAAAVQSKGA